MSQSWGVIVRPQYYQGTLNRPADRVLRVVDLWEMLCSEGLVTKEDVARAYDQPEGHKRVAFASEAEARILADRWYRGLPADYRLSHGEYAPPEAEPTPLPIPANYAAIPLPAKLRRAVQAQEAE